MKKIIAFLLCLPTFAQAALVEVTLLEQGARVVATPGSTTTFFLNPSLLDSTGNAFASATDATITVFSGGIDLSNELDFITVSSGGNTLGTVFVNNADLDPSSNPVSPLFEFYQTIVIPKDMFNSTMLDSVFEFELTYSDPLSDTGFAALRIGGSYFYDDGTVAVSAPPSLATFMTGLWGFALAGMLRKRVNSQAVEQ